MRENFYERLSYSIGNEDWRSDQRALQIKPGNRVVCITASGDRPLNLLTNDCAELICVDLNQIQNHLLRLKMAAINALNYTDYLTFLGMSPKSKRRDFLTQILPLMDKEARNFWESKRKMIEQGIIYQGALERCAKKIAFTIRLFRKSKIDKLFSFDDLEEQKRFLNKEWNTWFWRKIFDFNLYPSITRYFLKDPALSFNIDPSIKVGPYIYNRMSSCLNQNLAKSNSFLSLFLKGHVLPEGYPPYLTEEGILQIKSRLNRMSIKTMDVIEYLKKCPDNHFDAFSMSDVASYLEKSRFEELLKVILRTAKPNARFSIRQFLSTHSMPSRFEKHFKRDHALEKSLEKEDSCCIYNFIVGKIHKK